jgi:purine-binding chemotaxis protein CheW
MMAEMARSTPQTPSPLVVFVLSGWRFAMALSRVERVLPALEITPLPGAPSVVMGYINLHGDLIPVYDVHQRFDGTSRDIALSDQLLVVQATRGRVALRVEETTGVTDLALIPATTHSEDGMSRWFDGITQADGEVVLVQDVDKFLTSHETAALDAALERVA